MKSLIIAGYIFGMMGCGSVVFAYESHPTKFERPRLSEPLRISKVYSQVPREPGRPAPVPQVRPMPYPPLLPHRK